MVPLIIHNKQLPIVLMGMLLFNMFMYYLISPSLTHRIYISSDGSFLKVFEPIISSQAKLGNSGTYTCKVCFDQIQPFGPPLRRCVNSSSTVRTIGQKIYLHNILINYIIL